MVPCSGAARLHASPPYQAAMEDLKQLLHDTSCSIERILNRYNASNGKSSVPEVLELATSLSMGMTTVCMNWQESHNILNNGDVSMSSSRPLQVRPSSMEYCHGVQNLFSNRPNDISGLKKYSFGIDSESLNDETAFSNKDSLSAFLEEIKKTLVNWMSRQRALLQYESLNIIAASEDSFSFNHSQPNGAPSLLGSQTGHTLLRSMSPLEGIKQKERAVEVHQNQDGEETRRRGGLVQHHIRKHDESRGGIALQHAKDAGHIVSETEVEASNGLQKEVDAMACQLWSNEQPMTVHLQERSNNTAPERINNEVDTLPTKESVAPTASNTETIPLLNGNEPTAENSLRPTSADQIKTKLPLTKWTPPKSAEKASSMSLSISRAVEVITSPDWLPEGWVTEVRTRGSGNSAGSKDKYYVDPVSHRRFRSRKEVKAYLEHGKPKASDSPETSPVRRFSVPEVVASHSNKSTKKAKHKEKAAPISPAPSHSITPSIASPGCLFGNTFRPPFRTGQPSEWLVYESLASLPFPLFDPFYYSDRGVNKSSIGKSSYLPARPWFCSGPEASWSPFMGLGKPGDKVRDNHNYYSKPPNPSEAISKPAGDGVKKSLKRKSTAS